MSNKITEAYLDEIFDAFNQRDPELVAGYFADDGEFRAPLGPPPYGSRSVGKEQIKEFLSARWKKFPDMHWEGQVSLIFGDRATTTWKVSWTDENGQAHEWAGCDLYEFVGAKIKLKDTYWKHAA